MDHSKTASQLLRVVSTQSILFLKLLTSSYQEKKNCSQVKMLSCASNAVKLWEAKKQGKIARS